MTGTSDWAGSGGATWAERWRNTDRALEALERALVAHILQAAPKHAFRAFEIGCGAGVTAADVAAARPDAQIVACDVSDELLGIARQRLADEADIRFIVGDAAEAAPASGPFDLLYSRHGVMFFRDPPEAFAALRESAAPGGRLVFSCFRDWDLNPWASELATAAAGRKVSAPGREPSGFAFSDPAYVEHILDAAGWAERECKPVDFTYVAGEGANAVDEALDFLTDIGPAASAVRAMEAGERPAALERMREVLRNQVTDDRVAFPAAAWIWSASPGRAA